MSGNERAIVADVEFVVDGGHSGRWRRLGYALYVAALLLLTYGLTVTHAFFATQDPQWLRDQLLSWRGSTVLATVVVIGLLTAWRSGRVRGPAVPPLPWVDLVVAGGLDRALTLRRWWLVALLGLVTGGAMLGTVVGAGAWLAGVGDPAWLAVGAGLAAAIGWAHLMAWLAGQVSTSAHRRIPPVWHPRSALRLLRVEDLRLQAARATRMGGAVILGDLRAIRLETAAPVSRGRRRRLRPGARWSVVARRDLLGLRRQPAAAAAAAVTTAVGSAALAWSLLQPAVPVAVAIVGGLVLHLGCSAAAEGLRLQGDNAGTPSLLGLSTRREAVGHLAVPLLVTGATALLTGAAVALAGGAPAAVVLSTSGWLLLMVLVAAGTTTASAFRGGAPITAFIPEAGPVALLLWVSRQAVVATAAIGGLTASAAAVGLGPALVSALFVAAASLMWGLRRVDAVAMEHRV